MLVIYIKCVAVRMDCVFEHVCSFAQQHHYFMFSTLWYLLHQPNIDKVHQNTYVFGIFKERDYSIIN